MTIALATPPHDCGTDEEDNCWQCKGQPEADVFLRIHHTKLANQGANVDEEIKVVVDARLGNRRIDDNSLAAWKDFDKKSLHRNLFDNKRRDIRLEATRADAHDDYAKDERSHRSVCVGNDGWDG